MQIRKIAHIVFGIDGVLMLRILSYQVVVQIYNPYSDLPHVPPPNGTFGYSNCVPLTTSTTSSTSSTSTTSTSTTTGSPPTTTAAPCGTCNWTWVAPGAWTQVGYCENLACSCSQPGYAGSTYGENAVTMCS